MVQFIPATGWRLSLPWYDLLVRVWTNESQVKRALVSQINPQPGQSILDVGCGTGTLLIRLNSCCELLDLHGIDIDDSILKQARKKFLLLGLSDVIKIQHTRADRLPFNDHVFDHVVSSLVFHHLTRVEKQGVASEMMRVLRDDGTAYVADFGKATSWFSMLRFLVVRFIDGWERTKANTEGELPMIFEEAGFVSVVLIEVFETLLGTIQIFELKK